MSYDPNAPSGSNQKGLVFFGADSTANKYDADVSNLYYDSNKLFAPAIVIPNNGYIGSDSVKTAIEIDGSGNVTISGGLTVGGTTTTVESTNTVIQDALIELNNGVTSSTGDSGLIIERGSTGDNAIFVWDESEDRFTLGTTTDTGASSGNLSITVGTLAANIVGDLTGNLIVDDAAVDVAADSIFFRDSDDSGNAKRDTIADLVSGIAGTTANTSLSATSGVMTVEIDGTTISRNGSGQLVAVTNKSVGTLSAAGTVSNDVTLVTTSTNSFTVTMPASPSSGQVATVKKVDDGSGTLTVSGNTGHSIDGGSINLYYENESVNMVFYSNVWYLI